MADGILKSFFEDNPLAEDLSELGQFQYSIRFSKVPLFSDNSVRTQIASILMSEVVRKLNDLKLYPDENLSCEIGTDNVNLVYGDDIYHFRIRMDHDSFIFSRASGSILEFLELAELVLDDIVEIFKKIAEYYEGMRAQGAAMFNFTPHMCSYQYLFKIKNFRSKNRINRDSIKNYELMERLVPSVQTQGSPLSLIKFETRGRTNLTVSGSIRLDDIDWFAWTSIEAPGNKNYSMMDINFELQSIVHDKGGGRIPFNIESISKWRTATSQFIRDRMFCGFLQEWLKDVDFDC